MKNLNRPISSNTLESTFRRGLFIILAIFIFIIFSESCKKVEKNGISEQELMEQGRWEEALELAKQTRKPATVIHSTEEELRAEFKKAGLAYPSSKILSEKNGLLYSQLNRKACNTECEIYDAIQYYADLNNDGIVSVTDLLILSQYLVDNDDYYPNKIVCKVLVQDRTFSTLWNTPYLYVNTIANLSNMAYCAQPTCADEFDVLVISNVILETITCP